MEESILSPLPAPKCCFCCPVDTACYIFSILSSLKWGMFTVIVAFRFIGEPSFFGFIVFLICLVALMFSILLYYGTKKRRSDLLKIYLMYAVAMKILVVAAVIVYSLFMSEIVGGLIVLLVSMLSFYTGVFLLVKRTYSVFVAEESRVSGLLIGAEVFAQACDSAEL